MTGNLRVHLQDALGDAYRVERELGGGGMSRVFVARDVALARSVVIKVLPPELLAGVSVERFRREILLAARLQHPHIVPVLAAGDAAGLPYFTMPYVSDESLRTRLTRLGELPVAECVQLLRDVASALSYAHDNGVIHRDIKPDNVLLTVGAAVVTDFGVAKALTAATATTHAGGDASVSTSTGIALGTPAYMAPEQATADPSMDHRVDIYATGVLAYEMLVGRAPFAGRSPQATLAAHVTELPEAVSRLRPAVPAALAGLVMRCLEKHPADRPQNALELMQVLDALATPSQGLAPTGAMVAGRAAGRSGQTAPGHRVPRDAIVLLAVAAFVVAMIAVWRGGSRPQRQPAGPPPVAARHAADSVAVSGRAAETSAALPSQPTAPAPAPARSAAQRVGAAAPVRVPESQTSALMAQMRAGALGARTRAVGAGAVAAELASGDSALAAADSLLRAGRTADAARSINGATGLWAGAADAARNRQSAARSAAPATSPARSGARDSVPAPPVPAAPAPVAPPVSAPRPDARSAIAAVVSSYAAAIQARSVAGLRRVYPGLSAQQQRAWETFFAGITGLEASLELTGLQVAGDSAEALVAGTYSYANSSTHRNEQQPVSFRLTLHRDANGWRVLAVR